MSRRPKKQPSKKAVVPKRADSAGPHARGGSLSKSARRKWPVNCICALLIILVVLVFGQTLRHEFVNFDDDENVYEQPVIASGITLHGIAWAFTHTQVSRWAPVTTLSRMLDCQFYGLWAGGHHLTNLILHAITAVLLFLVLRQMTGALWRSAFVAGCFAIHPLQVETVAWVSARGDVLCGLFFVLTLRAYMRYVRGKEAWRRYAMVVVWFALGLMSKSMLVTIPFVLLLLDYWPLERLRNASQLPRLLKEKLPLFALSAVSCLATMVAQKQVTRDWDTYPINLRVANALVAYIIYPEKMFYPTELTAFYPFLRNGWPALLVIGAILLLGTLTAGIYILRRKQPFLLVGWLWYMGMLFPVMGFLQTGEQAYADRYTYLPQIGLWLAATWTAAGWAGESRRRSKVLAGIAGGILCVLALVTCHQTAYWHDSKFLWSHALSCTQENNLAHNNLGNALLQQGRLDEAIAEYREALRIKPNYSKAHYNLGFALLQKGRKEEAVIQFHEALRIDPNFFKASDNLGNVLLEQGRTDDAVAQYQESLRIEPDDAIARSNLGNVLLQKGKASEAITQYQEALRVRPGDAQIHCRLGNVLLQTWHTDEAVIQYREAVKIDPAYAEAHYNLATALYKQGVTEEVIVQMQKALDLLPSNMAIRNNLAWILASAPQASLRDGARALELAKQATQSEGGINPNYLCTLAAAYAGTGDFPEAIQTAQKALKLAETQSNTELVEALRRHLKLYEAGQRVENAR